MKTPDTCPVDGCDYDPRGDIDSLRGHVAAKGDHPSWGDLKGDLEGGDDPSEGDGSDAGDAADQPEGDPSEGGEPGDDDATDDQPENPPEGGPDGDPEGDGTDDMATPEEYESQHSGPSEGGEPGDDDATDDQPQEGRSTPLQGWASLPVDPRTFLTIIAVVAVAWMCYQAMTASEGAGATVETDGEAVESTTSTSTSDAPSAAPGDGGLVQ